MVKARARIKGKKKRWFQIIAPKILKEQVLGEIHLYEPSTAVGRQIKINLMKLTGDIKRQNTNIKFRIKDVKEGKLYTEITGYEIMPTSIKRMVRRRSSKIILSFPAKTSDNMKIKIKPIILTRGRVNQPILTKIRKVAEENIKAEAKKLTFTKLIEDLVDHKLQMNLKKQLKKIHPIRIIEINQIKKEEEPKETGKTAG